MVGGGGGGVGFFFNDTATTEIYTLSLHDALPIYNIFYGNGDVVNQPAELKTNLTGTDPKFVNPGEYDYHLSSKSPAIDAGSDPGVAGDFALKPVAHYIHPMKAQKRITIRKIDIGAYEYMIVRNRVARMK